MRRRYSIHGLNEALTRLPRTRYVCGLPCWRGHAHRGPKVLQMTHPRLTQNHRYLAVSSLLYTPRDGYSGSGLIQIRRTFVSLPSWHGTYFRPLMPHPSHTFRSRGVHRYHLATMSVSPQRNSAPAHVLHTSIPGATPRALCV